LLEKRYEDAEIISAMMEDVYWLYEQAVKKAMIDYILLEQSEMVRIGVFRMFQPAPFYGQERLVYKGFLASREVQRKNRISRSVLEETLSLTSTYMLEIQKMWREYEDKLLLELPRPGQDYITIDEF
jgi:dynein heavy chain